MGTGFHWLKQSLLLLARVLQRWSRDWDWSMHREGLYPLLGTPQRDPRRIGGVEAKREAAVPDWEVGREIRAEDGLQRFLDC